MAEVIKYEGVWKVEDGQFFSPVFEMGGHPAGKRLFFGLDKAFALVLLRGPYPGTSVWHGTMGRAVERGGAVGRAEAGRSQK